MNPKLSIIRWRIDALELKLHEVRWYLGLLLVAVLIWRVSRHQPDVEKEASSLPLPKQAASNPKPSTISPKLIDSTVAALNSKTIKLPVTKPPPNHSNDNETVESLKSRDTEAKQDIHFLNTQKNVDIKKLLSKSKPWGLLPMANKFGISLTGSNCGNIKFKAGMTNGTWRIILNSSYRDNGNGSQNFGSIAVLKGGVLKSFHTSDEPGFFQGDPDEPTHFIIKASKIMYIQFFNMETTADADVTYYYAGNVFIPDQTESQYFRVGITLLDGGGCGPDDAQGEGLSGSPPVDELSLKLFQKATAH